MKVRDMEETTGEGRNRWIMKEVVGCVQDVYGKNKFLVRFEDGHKK